MTTPQQPELAPGEVRNITIPALLCRCARCGYQWTTRNTEPPKTCPGGLQGCGHRGWRTLPGTVRRGRPPGTGPLHMEWGEWGGRPLCGSRGRSMTEDEAEFYASPRRCLRCEEIYGKAEA